MYNINIEFEYDPEKSRANLEKHGISLEQAKELWAGPHVITNARSEGAELRWIVVAQLKGKMYSCIYTARDEKIRLVSARRSHSNEEKIYWEGIRQHEKDIR